MCDCRSGAVWTLLLVWLNSASCQLVVRGFVGEDVVLPCIYSNVDPLPDKVSVFWRDKDDRVVLDIVENSEDQMSQNVKFKGRVSSFPEQYRKGNFSVVIKTLRQDDGGPYDCTVHRMYFQRTVSLTVSGERDVGVSLTPPPGGAAVTNSLHLRLLAATLTLLFCCVT